MIIDRREKLGMFLFVILITLVIGVLIWIYRRPVPTFFESITLAILTASGCLIAVLIVVVLRINIPRFKEWMWLDKEGMQWRR